MALILYREKRVVFRVAYMGIPASGKSTVLKALHRSSDPELRSPFAHTFLDLDRVLSFDLKLPQVSVIPGFDSVVRLITLPGYPTRTQPYRRILKAIDGISFVIDSQWERMPENVNALSTIQDILAQHKTSFLEVPYNILYNKRDMPNVAPLEYLDMTFAQRPTGVSSVFETQAHQGIGVQESFQGILDKVTTKYV